MTLYWTWIAVLALSTLLAALMPVSYALDEWKEPYPGIKYRFELSRSSYHPGEKIVVTVELVNEAEVTVTTSGGYIKLRGPDQRMLLEFRIPSGLSLKPGQRFGPITQPVWTVPSDFQPGLYSVMILVKTNVTDFSEEISFRIEPPKSPSSIKLSSAGGSLNKGEGVEIVGELQPPISGAYVTLWVSKDGVEWDKVVELITDDSGRFYHKLVLENGSYIIRASWAGDEGHPGCSSNLLPVSVGGSPLYLVVEKTVTVTTTIGSEAVAIQTNPMSSLLKQYSLDWILALPIFLLGAASGFIGFLLARSSLFFKERIAGSRKAFTLVAILTLSLSLISLIILLLGYGPLTMGIQLLESFGMKAFTVVAMAVYFTIMVAMILALAISTVILYQKVKTH